mmetsp:Transcript_115017/g.371960  ORF Transcript_115017/g.371960 Transcript_115017/m.371960 type:complete len:165 (-) Transcript_115017:672-1166(-)
MVAKLARLASALDLTPAAAAAAEAFTKAGNFEYNVCMDPAVECFKCCMQHSLKPEGFGNDAMTSTRGGLLNLAYNVFNASDGGDTMYSWQYLPQSFNVGCFAIILSSRVACGNLECNFVHVTASTLRKFSEKYLPKLPKSAGGAFVDAIGGKSRGGSVANKADG